MAGIIGTGLGIGGSIAGGIASRQDSKQALDGYNYLSGTTGKTYVPTGEAANSDIAALLGIGGDPAAATKAYKNYLGSTGYNFQMDQGRQAVTGSAASRGVLNSGATAKALTTFGQGLASTSFNNYLKDLGGLSTTGLTAAGQIGEAGTQGGGNFANNATNPNSSSNVSGILGNVLGSIGGMF